MFTALAYFKKDPTLGTPRAFSSLFRSIDTVYEKYIKLKSPADNISLGFFLCHSASMDGEFKAVYDKYKSYDWTEHIMVSRDDLKQKKWRTPEHRAQTLLLVILCGK